MLFKLLLWTQYPLNYLLTKLQQSELLLSLIFNDRTTIRELKTTNMNEKSVTKYEDRMMRLHDTNELNEFVILKSIMLFRLKTNF